MLLIILPYLNMYKYMLPIVLPYHQCITIPTIYQAKRVVKMGRDKLLLEDGEKTESEGRLKLLKMTADVDEEKIKSKYDDEDEGGDDDNGARRNEMKSINKLAFTKRNPAL